MITTIFLPAFSGLFPTATAAAIAAPEEIPTKIPSFAATVRANWIAVSPGTFWISLISEVSQFAGIKPAPIP
jgi:hypothetical protein